MDNSQIADRLEALAVLLELVDSNPHAVRAYRRAADTIREAAFPIAELVASGRARELRGIGPSIEARLRELVETGAIAELDELERELAPDLVGLGRYLGLGARRAIELARALGVRTADELREAASEGRLRTVPGIGPKTEARLREALAHEGSPRPRRGLLLDRARELVGGIAAALEGGEAAGDVRRWRDSCEALAVVGAAADPSSVLEEFAALPQIVALVETGELRAVGVTVEGVPVEVVVAPPERFGTALVRATGAPAYVAALEPLPEAPDEGSVYRALDVPWCPPELREEPFRVLRGIECDILADGSLDLPDDVLSELEWVQASVHGGQRMPRRQLTRRVEEALRNPYVRCLSHPKGRYINRRPENDLDLDRVFEVALEEEVALEVNGLPDRLDLSGEHVRDALGAGVEIVCSTDAHSVRGLGNMTLSVATARRGWASAANVLNTRPLSTILQRRRP